jgi:hypothetical protein
VIADEFTGFTGRLGEGFQHARLQRFSFRQSAFVVGGARANKKRERNWKKKTKHQGLL